MAESIYFYNPSLAAAILFTVLYLVPFLYHLYISFIAPYTGKYHHTGYFVPILIGAATEVGAYAVRAASVKTPDDVGLYATSATLIVVAPVLVCASLYILIGKLIRSSGRDSSPETETKEPPLLFERFSPSWIPRVFVTSDIVSFLTQAAGSGIASSNDWQGKEKDVGVGILIAGLALQLFTFAFFLVVVVWFDVRVFSSSSAREGSAAGVRMVLNGIYVAGSLIMVRLIYRVIEFSMGMDTYTWTHEWPLYVLEAVPMLFAMLALGWYHPARWLAPGFGARMK
ncbi:RTA1 like protein-domain-containing protein [Aspergillus avenaceus]|uniref:RTA1 like protein-domain-containing protein n=1 Tax=Aspergillus avenaceus TaxID=36643 RepID=A0A5N6TZD7_ASPAV|nr:RTA1 like protein-domain-containing protein [Aspergillus avenaceus]